MMRVRTLVALCLVIVCPACASAQTSGMRPFRTLASSVSQADAAGTRELRIQWTATSPAPGAQSTQALNSFTVLQQTRSNTTLRRERQPQVSADHLVVVVQDGSGREVDWRVVANPRVLRAEVPGPDGQLTGRRFEQGTAEILLTIPDIAGAERLQIYRPVWSGKEYDLEPLAQVYIGTAR